jgi:hypothetical protein
MSASGNGVSEMVAQMLAHTKDLTATSAANARAVEAARVEAAMANAKAEAADAKAVEAQSATDLFRSQIQTRLDKQKRMLTNRFSRTGSSGRSSPTSAMSEKSQTDSEMGEPTDADTVQVVLGKMPGVTAQMPLHELLVDTDRSSLKLATGEMSGTCSEMGKIADTGAAQGVSVEIKQITVEMPQTDLWCAQTPLNVQADKATEGPQQSP